MQNMPVATMSLVVLSRTETFAPSLQRQVSRLYRVCTGAHHNGYGGELPPGVGAHGSYGQGKGAGRRWYYYGDPGNAGTYVDTVPGKGQLNYTSGNEPAMAMWGAVEEMLLQVEATWREVWNS